MSKTHIFNIGTDNNFHLEEDAGNARTFKEIRSYIDEEVMGGDRLIISLKNVNYVASQTLGDFTAINKALSERHAGKLMLAGCNDVIRTKLHVTKLDSLFTIHDDIEAARQAASEGQAPGSL